MGKKSVVPLVGIWFACGSIQLGIRDQVKVAAYYEVFFYHSS